MTRFSLFLSALVASLLLVAAVPTDNALRPLPSPHATVHVDNAYLHHDDHMALGEQEDLFIPTTSRGLKKKITKAYKTIKRCFKVIISAKFPKLPIYLKRKDCKVGKKKCKFIKKVCKIAKFFSRKIKKRCKKAKKYCKVIKRRCRFYY